MGPGGYSCRCRRRFANPYTNADADGNSYSYTYCNAKCNTNSNAYSYAKSDPKAAAHAVPSANALVGTGILLVRRALRAIPKRACKWRGELRQPLLPLRALRACSPIVPLEHIEFVLVRPFVRAANVAMANGVIRDVLPLFCVGFGTTQLPIPKLTWPNWNLGAMRPCSRDVISPGCDPLL